MKMETKGSLVIKRRHLLNMKANLTHMWKNSNMDDGVRSHVFGQMVMFDRMLENDYQYRWNDFMQGMVWTGSYCTCPPSKTFEWLHDPNPLEIEETLHLYTQLNWWAENKDEVNKMLEEMEGLEQ